MAILECRSLVPFAQYLNSFKIYLISNVDGIENIINPGIEQIEWKISTKNRISATKEPVCTLPHTTVSWNFFLYLDFLVQKYKIFSTFGSSKDDNGIKLVILGAQCICDYAVKVSCIMWLKKGEGDIKKFTFTHRKRGEVLKGTKSDHIILEQPL